MEPLSAADTRKVARLSRLSLSDEQVERYRSQLSAVLGYVERLRRADLAGVEPMAHVGDAVNRLDDDVPGPTLPNSVLMQMAPEAMEPFIKVPKVLDDGGAA
jgi:aspartyl-tRNA(Asn)/glutamyl-tRNA(Gln) amidotransferase subunit C